MSKQHQKLPMKHKLKSKIPRIITVRQCYENSDYKTVRIPQLKYQNQEHLRKSNHQNSIIVLKIEECSNLHALNLATQNPEKYIVPVKLSKSRHPKSRHKKISDVKIGQKKHPISEKSPRIIPVNSNLSNVGVVR